MGWLATWRESPFLEFVIVKQKGRLSFLWGNEPWSSIQIFLNFLFHKREPRNITTRFSFSLLGNQFTNTGNEITYIS
jgi:hypothetical protein